MKSTIIGASLGAGFMGLCGPFTYWLSGRDFHRCEDFAWMFVLTLIFMMGFGILGGLLGSFLPETKKGGLR